MICKIAELIIDVPATGDMLSRCKDYVTDEKVSADIIIRADLYNPNKYRKQDEASVSYMESGYQFTKALLDFDGFYLHSSAIEYEGRAYLFSGPCGVGKSTHTRLWQQMFGEAATVFNDDKPALRCIDGMWYAYGTPWCGKDGINQNKKVKLAGVCFLSQAKENKIIKLNSVDAITEILLQTNRRFHDVRKLDLLLSHIENLIETVPVYKFYNRPMPESALLSYETMRTGAEEMSI